MIEIWYAILAFVLTGYLLLDGRNFGVGALYYIVARTRPEKRQIVDAVGPLWSWHEVWLLVVGGVLFVAFPRFMAVAFPGYYLALFLVLWALIIRGVSLEVGSHVDNVLWHQFWDFALASSSILLAILFGTALGNVARGVPVDSTGEFQMAFFTDFTVRGHVGLLDWYTVSLGIFTLFILSAHGATYLAYKTEGAVQERSLRMARWLWPVLCAGAAIVAIETWVVRPALLARILQRPLAWIAVILVIAGGVALFIGLRRRKDALAFAGSRMVVIGLLGAGAALLFPDMLVSTLGDAHSLTVYNTAASHGGLVMALTWLPFALALSYAYFFFILRQYRGKVKPSDGTHDEN